MRPFKLLIINLFHYFMLIILSCFYMYVLLNGKYGFYNLYGLINEKKMYEQMLLSKYNQCALIQSDLLEWQKTDFLIESIARNKLHMAKREDIVYYIKNSE